MTDDIDEKGRKLASETLARLYEEQGNIEQAAAIREQLTTPGAWPVAFQSEPAEKTSRNEVTVTPEGSHTVRCRWKMTAEAMQIVKRNFPESLKEHSKALTAVLRVVVVRPSSPSPRRQYLDVDVPDMAGSCLISELKETPGWLCAAVGLKHASGRFHPTAHSDVIDLQKVSELHQPRGE